MGAALGGCGPTITAPDVVGMRLDAAHRKFEKLEVTEFDDKDVLKDRTIFLDNGWVVLKQKPAAGTKDVDTGTTIELSVAKVSDKKIRDKLPADAPVIVELDKAAAKEKRDEIEAAEEKVRRDAEEAADEAKEKAADAAAATKDAREYADKLAGTARGFREVLKRYDENAALVREAGGGNEVAAGNALAAQEFFETGRNNLVLATPPGGLDLGGVNTDMSEAMGTLASAADALLVAIDTGAPSALAQERRQRDRGRDLWAKSMRRIARAADRAPILPPG